MCPVAGGVLASKNSKIQKELGIDMPTTQMALTFVLSNPNVSTACSGMNTIEMLDENVSIVKADVRYKSKLIAEAELSIFTQD